MDLDTAHLAALLRAAARTRDSVTYAQVLGALGHRFSRPRMRALCVLLADVDAAERGAGRPALAPLVVRQSDRLPGQGWWLAEARDGGYAGPWLGPDAAAHLAARHAAIFDYWAA